VKPEFAAANSESQHKLGNSGGVRGPPTVAAWTIVAVLALVVVIGFGTLRGQANTSDGVGVVNPAHDARCSDLLIARLDRCQAQRPLEPEGWPDSL
jgi:hypothetical protein